ncbi:MAG TPA: hypothetical protein PLD38_15710 [Pyrinomonadaceae bacterium]|nr:hypothetical protein [Chloracidobacterium sp.]MBK7801240.1 hypothetical protein [Chloracidobacterium sp.]MBL0241546.1 hypothetical protein [Chloracidobacterium sp.]MBP9109311.1 hypothetical protein [Pyrinomonadaceae bacterium]HQY68722.1 hypothetical protein [Pyrinomonadaceae bacterium]
MKNVTLIHPADRSTDDLKLVYAGLGLEPITNTANANLLDAVAESERTICLGHGVPQGLIGTGMRLCVNETFVPLFKDQPNNIYIWCNADQYVKDHKLSAFCTGMFISEPQEAYVFGIGATPEQLTYSNRLFSRLVNQGIKTGLSNWRLAEHVLTHYNDPTNSAIEYNRQRIFAFDGGCVTYGHLGSTPAPRAAAYTAA